VTDYLTKRNGYWQFARRVPLDYAHLDDRVVIKHSTKVLVAKDRRGTKAVKVANAMNRALEAYWRGLSEGKAQEAQERYDEARYRSRVFGSIMPRRRSFPPGWRSTCWSGLRSLRSR
jgi:hypothetical protein